MLLRMLVSASSARNSRRFIIDSFPGGRVLWCARRQFSRPPTILRVGSTGRPGFPDLGGSHVAWHPRARYAEGRKNDPGRWLFT